MGRPSFPSTGLPSAIEGDRLRTSHLRSSAANTRRTAHIAILGIAPDLHRCINPARRAGSSQTKKKRSVVKTAPLYIRCYPSRTFLACCSLTSSFSSLARSARIPATFSSCLPICSKTIATGVFLIQALRVEAGAGAGEADAKAAGEGEAVDALDVVIAPACGLWFGCEGAVLLRKQEQEAAHGGDLSLDAIETAKSGAVASSAKVVCHCPELREELRIYCPR